MSKGYAAVVIYACLSGCASIGAFPSAQCIAKPVQKFVGTKYANTLDAELLKLSKSSLLRVWSPEMTVPGDRTFKGLTVELDSDEETIVRIHCGN